MLQLPGEVVWPLGRMLAFPHGKNFSTYGLIAAGPWVLLCSRAARAVVRTVFPQRSPVNVNAAAMSAAKTQADAIGGVIQPVPAEVKKDQ